MHRNAGYDKNLKREIEIYKTFCIVYYNLLGIFICLDFIFTLTFHIISNMMEYVSKAFIGIYIHISYSNTRREITF